MTGSQWLGAAVLALAGVLIALNWIGLVGAMFSRPSRSYSFAPPFLAGIAGSIVALLHGSEPLRELWFVPLVLDPSIGLALPWLAVQRLKSWLQRRGRAGD